MYNNLYEFSQNNSGGGFEENDKICHTVVIQAGSAKEANKKAEELGVYFDGCDKGLDCSCCGDRWYEVYNPIDLERINERGSSADVFKGSSYDDRGSEEVEAEWDRKYRGYDILEEPKWQSVFYRGKIKFKDELEYLQFHANEYGRMFDKLTRVYFKDGTVVELKAENEEQ